MISKSVKVVKNAVARRSNDKVNPAWVPMGAALRQERERRG